MGEDFGVEVRFSDGAMMAVHPGPRVMNVTAPQGRACSLKSTQGRGYLAALCHDQAGQSRFMKILGEEPWRMAGFDSPPSQDEQLPHRPHVEGVHKVDVIV